MGKSKEPLDAVKEGRPFAGVHILATAMMCSTGASADELELARRILERDPARDAPRESESIAGAFNRQLDAAIDSVNDSTGESTRVGRRVRLARDLDHAGLLLVDRATVADLIGEIRGLRDELARVDGEDLGAELAGDGFIRIGDFLETRHGGLIPIGDFLESDERAGDVAEHQVND